MYAKWSTSLYGSEFDVLNPYDSETHSTSLLDEKLATIGGGSSVNVTERDLVDAIRPTGDIRYILLFTLIVMVSLFLYGYDVAATTAILVPIDAAYPENSIENAFNLDAIWKNILFAGSTFGSTFCNFLLFFCGNYLGRNGVFVVACGFYFGGSLIQGASINEYVLLAGRIVYGFGIGFALHSSIIYLGEISPGIHRGFFVGIMQLGYLLGMVTGYGQGFIWAENQIGWRWIYWGSCFFSILFGILLYFLPQSPRWLVLKALRGSTPLQMRELLLNKAHFKLAAIRKLTDVRVQYEFNEFVDNLTANKDRFSYFQTFKQRPFYRALSICAFLVIFQQLIGRVAVNYYAPMMFMNVGFTMNDSYIFSLLVLAIYPMLIVAIASIISDSKHKLLGRRFLLLTGIGIVYVGLLIIGLSSLGLTATGLRVDIQQDLVSSSFSIIGLVIYVTGYYFSFGTVTFILISELFPMRLRNQGVAIVLFLNFFLESVFIFSAKWLINVFHPAPMYLFYSFFCILAEVYVIFFIPKTKKKTLEQIEQLLADRGILVVSFRSFKKKVLDFNN